MAIPKQVMSWIGHTIGGRYQIEAVLGQGGMSTVYRAKDLNLQRAVAIKLIHAHLSNDPTFVRRFEQEAAAVAQLRHPNIIQVYDFNHEGDVYYMVLDYVPGRTLKEWLKILNEAKRKIPLAEASRIMAIVCEAVAYAHQHGMIHRDLKPANLMLNPKGQPVLMDFGVAKMMGGEDYTATGTIIGTAKYMSPEQARGEHPDERSDIYSLGIMLYELVAGQPPFDADTTVAVLMKHVYEPVPDIRQIQSNIPDELVEIIGKALAKDRKDRYQNASHMVAALKLVNRLAQTPAPAGDAQQTVTSKKRNAVESPPVTPLPLAAKPSLVTPTEPSTHPTRRSGSLFWLIGAAVMALLLLFGFGAYLAFTQLRPISNLGGGAALALRQPLPSAAGMVPIKAGVYTVGLDGPDKDHAPTQQVELAQFWIDQREATQAQYAEFLAATDNPPPAGWPGGEIPPEQEKLPVKGVTWDIAATYCAWANKRLPTEAEWEVAARGVDGRLYPWGDKQSAVKLPRNETYPVGSKLTNQSPFGVLDMAGNVWEWVAEPYAPVAEGSQVLRGGANDFLKDMAFRLQGDPSSPTMIAWAGLRCAADQVESLPTQIADQSILYEDNFANPGSGWPIRSEGSLFFGYHPPDFYHVEVGTADNYTAVSRPPAFDNINAETEVLVDHTDTENGDFRYGLVVRRNGDNYYAFTISSRRGSWQVLRSSAAGLETLAEGAVETLHGFAPKGFTPDKTDSLQVEANGKDFVFHVNGQTVAQLSDPAYAAGEVGFFVETSDETLAHVHFDSLTIR